jgi:hypothetical protein
MDENVMKGLVQSLEYLAHPNEIGANARDCYDYFPGVTH